MKNLFDNVLQELNNATIRDVLPLLPENYQSEHCVIFEFASCTWAEVGTIPESKHMGIYLSFCPDNPVPFLNHFLTEGAYIFFPKLREILSSLYSEATNNDAYSFEFIVDTDRMNTTCEPCYSIEVHIKEYLS